MIRHREDQERKSLLSQGVLKVGSWQMGEKGSHCLGYPHNRGCPERRNGPQAVQMLSSKKKGLRKKVTQRTKFGAKKSVCGKSVFEEKKFLRKEGDQ